MRKTIALGLTVAGLVTWSTVWAWARPRPQDAASSPGPDARGNQAQPLDTRSTAIRIRLGVGDTEVRPWGGTVSVDRGSVAGVEGWRFRDGDAVRGADSWTVTTRRIRTTAANKKAAAKKAITRPQEKGGPSNVGAAVTANGVVVRLDADVTPEATLTLESEQGAAKIPLSDLAGGAARRYLDGRIEARLVPPYAPVATTEFQEDFPAAVSDGSGGAWIAYVEHRPRGPEVSEALTQAPKSFRDFIPTGGGDQIKLIHYAIRNGQGSVERVVDVTDSGLDVWRPAVAVDDEGGVVVVWSEHKAGNWDLFRRRYEPESNSWGTIRRMTSNTGTDTDAVLVNVPGDGIWTARRSWRTDFATIMVARVDPPTSPLVIIDERANSWSPSIAYHDGRLYVAYDTYAEGNYDVRLAVVEPGDQPRLLRTVTVAGSPRFEARPTVAVDSRGRAWVAYEERTENWGKDFGNIPDDPGTPLYAQSAVRVRCIEGDNVLDAGDPVAAASADEQVMNAFARIALDRTGRPRLLFRHRQEAVWGNNAVMVVGGVWIEYATAMVGTSWTPPQPLPRSDGLLDNRPSIVSDPQGGLLVFYNSDGRLHREVEFSDDLRRRFYTHSGTPPGIVNNDLFVAVLDEPDAYDGRPEAEPGGPIETSPSNGEPADSHTGETEAVARMRRHRIQAGGKTYQLLRGEFHRHTEISQDGGNDGALEDMWRYALDAGRLDWIGNGDHDNGGGKEYTWWLVQKTTDLHHNPPAFVPMFTYERSVGYPGGHRNVMFPFRGVRTLPRLVNERGVMTDINGQDLDAAMLYRYLNELGGICAVHTSATGMGTDFRQNDPKAEPFVEIYQGIRNSYEHLGGPRVAHSPRDAVGGWRPLGMVWNALAYQYKLAFQSSSDHISTHISFGIAIAEAPTRAAIFDAFANRHCYAATDNILLDVRCGEHLMGDEFEIEGPVALNVLAHGTNPIARVDIIKDFHFVYSAEPKTERVEFVWTDEEAINREPSWYYVRVLQEDGQIAWGSPMWIHAATGRTRGNGSR